MKEEYTKIESLKFRLSQAISSLPIFLAILNYDEEVDTVFLLGAWSTACVTFIYHGLQPVSKKRWNCNIFGWQFSFCCSELGCDIHKYPLLTKIQHIDRMCVCFIILHLAFQTPISLPFLITMCVLGGIGPFRNTIIVGGLAIPIGIMRPKFLSLPPLEIVVLLCALITGVFINIFGPKRWPAPLRFTWHICCGILVRIAGILNTRTNHIYN